MLLVRNHYLFFGEDGVVVGSNHALRPAYLLGYCSKGQKKIPNEPQRVATLYHWGMGTSAWSSTQWHRCLWARVVSDNKVLCTTSSETVVLYVQLTSTIITGRFSAICIAKGSHACYFCHVHLTVFRPRVSSTLITLPPVVASLRKNGNVDSILTINNHFRVFWMIFVQLEFTVVKIWLWIRRKWLGFVFLSNTETYQDCALHVKFTPR